MKRPVREVLISPLTDASDGPHGAGPALESIRLQRRDESRIGKDPAFRKGIALMIPAINSFQNGLMTTRITMATINMVGISLITR